jgi:hypothetical protein
MKRKLRAEGHKVVQKGKRFFVEDFQRNLAGNFHCLVTL